MKRRLNIRLRVAIYLAVFSATLSLLLVAGLYAAAHDVGQRLIDQTLRAELEDYIARRIRNPNSLPPSSMTLRGYVEQLGQIDDGIPANIRALPEGKHEILLNNIPYRVAIDIRDDMRFYLIFDETRQRVREHGFLMYLLASALCMTLVAAAGGWWLAGRVISPLTRLAHKLTHTNPATPPQLTDESARRDEIGELARMFNQYLQRIHAFVDRERNFTSDVSHELRTPVAVIQGSLEVIQSDPNLDPGMQPRLQRIERATKDMAELIRALLLLAREESHPETTMEECNIAVVLREVIERHRVLLMKHNTNLSVEIISEPLINAEPILFSVVASNLIRNAFTYTESGSVTIRLLADRLIVSDTGVGIASEEMGKLFQRYYRGSTSQGSGIGLSLVKRICDRYQWQIVIESREHVGTSAQLIFEPPAS